MLIDHWCGLLLTFYLTTLNTCKFKIYRSQTLTDLNSIFHPDIIL